MRLAPQTFLALMGPLTAYKRAHRAIEVQLQRMPAEEMARRLQAQDIDLCAASQPISTEGLESILLLADAGGHSFRRGCRLKVRV